MQRFLQNREKMQRALREYSRTGTNRVLKYCAIGSCLTAAALLLIVAFRYDYITDRTELLLRGCAGALAILSVIFAAIYIYRCYHALWKNHTRQ